MLLPFIYAMLKQQFADFAGKFMNYFLNLFGSKWFKYHINVKNRENFLLINIKIGLFCFYLAISSP